MYRDRYAPKMPPKKPINKRLIRILIILGVLFLLTEILLMALGVVAGVMMVNTWMYLVSGGMAVLCFLGAAMARAFQSRTYRLAGRMLGVTLVCLALSVAISVGTVLYSMHKEDSAKGMFDSPNGQYSLYVVRVASYDDSGNELSAVYRGYRCFGHSAYIYAEDEVPAGDSFEVKWLDDENAELSSMGESVVISFTPAK